MTNRHCKELGRGEFSPVSRGELEGSVCAVSLAPRSLPRALREQGGKLATCPPLNFAGGLFSATTALCHSEERSDEESRYCGGESPARNGIPANCGRSLGSPRLQQG